MDSERAENDLILRALDSLRGHGLEGQVFSWAASGSADGIDALVHISRGERTSTVAVVARAVVRPSTLGSVLDRLPRAADPATVLVSEHISATTAELLRGRGVQFIDAVGNAFLDTPHHYVLITGRRPTSPATFRSPDRVGPAALQVMFVLLRDPAAGALSVRALGERAGVSHGAAALALQVFANRGWIRHVGRVGGYRVVDLDGMLSSWEHGFTDQLSPKLEITRATSPGAPGTSAWARSVLGHFSEEWGLLGGEGAAEISGHNLRGVTASVYVPRWDAATMKQLRLVPSERGPIAVRAAFAPHMQDPRDPRLADPLLVLAEVASIPDERVDDTRRALRALVTARFQT